jgi:predicted amidohydrolase
LREAPLQKEKPIARMGRGEEVTMASQTKLRIRAVNFVPVLHDKPATAAKITVAIEEAARDSCDLVVLPEMALQGFEMCQACLDAGHACERHLAVAEPADGPLMGELVETVRRLGLYAVIGFGERDPVRPCMYNAAAVIGPEGMIGTTRKLGVGSGGRGPLNYEDTFTSGEQITVYPTRFGPIGVGICYDMWINPEIGRIMVLKGAKMLVIPTATVATTTGGDIEAMAFTRARENGVFVINANLVQGHIGREEHPEVSHSYIAGPDFPRMARIWASTDDPFGAVTADIELGKSEVLHIRDVRMADGNRAHISRIVAEEFAALAGLTAPALAGVSSHASSAGGL